MNEQEYTPIKRFRHAKGVTYFNRETERTLFFVVTLIMLGWLFLDKFGLI